MKNWIRVGNRMINLDHVSEIMQTTCITEGDPEMDQVLDVTEDCVLFIFPDKDNGRQREILITGEDNQKLRHWMDKLCPEHLQFDTTRLKRTTDKEDA